MRKNIPDSNPDKIVTIEVLSASLKSVIGYTKQESEEDAENILEIFGFDKEVLDYQLQKEDRQLFYKLVDYGFLTTDRDETELYDGRIWKTHYWVLRKDFIFNCEKQIPIINLDLNENVKAEDIYKNLDWSKIERK